MSSIKSATNNTNFSCPAQMADGRIFTDYEPNCELNNSIQETNDIKNSYLYRQYLIKNANTIIDTNRTLNATQNGCAGCDNPLKDTTMNGMSENNELNMYSAIDGTELDSSGLAPFNT